MIISLITLLVVSYGVRYLFVSKILREEFDILDCNLANGGRTIDQYLDDDENESPKAKRSAVGRSTSTAAELRSRYHQEGNDEFSAVKTTSFNAESSPPPYDEGVSNVAFESDAVEAKSKL